MQTLSKSEKKKIIKIIGFIKHALTWNEANLYSHYYV